MPSPWESEMPVLNISCFNSQQYSHFFSQLVLRICFTSLDCFFFYYIQINTTGLNVCLLKG